MIKEVSRKIGLVHLNNRRRVHHIHDLRSMDIMSAITVCIICCYRECIHISRTTSHHSTTSLRLKYADLDQERGMRCTRMRRNYEAFLLLGLALVSCIRYLLALLFNGPSHVQYASEHTLICSNTLSCICSTGSCFRTIASERYTRLYRQPSSWQMKKHMESLLSPAISAI